MDIDFSVPRDHPDFHLAMQKQTSVMVWVASVQTAWVTGIQYVWQYHWHGGIYWECTKTNTAIKMTYFMWSPWLLDQDNAGLILRVLQQCGRHRVYMLDWPACSPHLSPLENVWPVKATTITDCWASEVLYQVRLDKNCARKTLTISIPFKHCN